LTDPLTGQRQAIVWRLLERHHQRALRLLDCGAGAGGLVADACARGHSAIGIEVSRAAVERARSLHGDLDIRCHSVEHLPWPVEPSSFDVVVSFEVVEHLLEPRALLRGARTALVDGGRLVLSTPFHGRLKNVILAAVGFERHFDVDGDHVRFFTDRSLASLLRSEGFEVEALTHLGRRAPVWANTVVVARKASAP
jgi:2-polyprenyl-3-methyl-5-hydroxy-6-metoxy-1,4-benzoquinol methylase